LKLKSTTWVLLAVVAIFAGLLIAGGGQLWRRVTAPRIDPDAMPVATVETATAEPTALAVDAGWERKQDAQSGRTYLAPPTADVAALRNAFAVLLHRTRVQQTSQEALLAYDLDLSRAQAAHLVAEGYAWPLLDIPFVFVYTELGPENEVRCTGATHCRVTQAVLGIQSVLIFDAAMCGSPESTPCLAPLTDEQIDARDNLVTADFHKEVDGVWRLVAWETTPLPALPDGW
jgi:hypothetical protein